MSLETLQRGFRKEFAEFYRRCFSRAVLEREGRFIWGEHMGVWARRMQYHDRTATVGPRKHFKSYTFYAKLMWKMFCMWWDAKQRGITGKFYEVLYLSYKAPLAQYHLKNVKKLIKVSPYHQEWKDLTGGAQSILGYGYKGCEFWCEPEGVMSFMRGRHPHEVYCDDILRDPTEKLEIKTIEAINKTYREQIESLPKEGGQIHTAGTAQDPEDLFFQLKKNKKYHWGMYPAVLDFKEEIVLFPELFPWERLMEIKDVEIGEKAFNKEYMCSPQRLEEAYFKPEEIDDIIDKKLVNQDPNDFRPTGVVVAGLDIGKKRCPSHLVAFMKKEKTMVQILSKWMDNWDYLDQVVYCKLMIERWGAWMLYDNTRGELEAFEEQNMLPSEMEPVTLAGKERWLIASALNRRVAGTGGEKLVLLPDDRQRRQLLVVDNQLKAPETGEGHGDAFWSLGLACRRAEMAVGDTVSSTDYY